jgi:hypothetical protein
MWVAIVDEPWNHDAFINLDDGRIFIRPHAGHPRAKFRYPGMANMVTVAQRDVVAWMEKEGIPKA